MLGRHWGRVWAADQRHHEEGCEEQGADQHDRIVVGQYQRLALHQIGEELDRRASGGARNQRIKPLKFVYSLLEEAGFEPSVPH